MTASGTRRLAGEDTDCVVEVVDWKTLCGHREAWKALSQRTVEPNVFYDPDFAIPAADALGLSGRLSALLVWLETQAASGAGSRRLAGLFPFVERRRWAVPVWVGEALIHPYAMSSAPLVDTHAADDVIGAFLDWLNMARQAPAAWLFRFLPGDGRLRFDLGARAERSDMLVRAFAPHARAILDTSELDADYLRAALSRKARKEHARLWRKLASRGSITATRATSGTAVAAAMTEFLALEASGWKGRRGTAAASSADIAAMFAQIGRGLSAAREIRIDALRVGGKPVSMTVSCGKGNRWWLWKIAYDEAFAAVSPGVLLVLHLTDAALKAGTGICYDSCSLPGHPMIERIWRQRRPYADMLIVPARLGRMRQVVVQLESMRRAAERGGRRMRRLAARR